MGNNFNATRLTSLQSNAQKVFEDLITNLKEIQKVCEEMGILVISEDSSLASRWNSIGASLLAPIINADGTFRTIYDLLLQYVNKTLENEEEADKQLTYVDEEIQALGESANQIVDLSGVLGTGFAVGGIASYMGGTTTKYAPPSVDDATISIYEGGTTTKYAPPSISDGGQGFGMIDGGVTTKYAPPSMTDGGQGFGMIDGGVTTKYAPPSMTDGGQGFGMIDGGVTTKYAPPTITDGGQSFGIIDGGVTTKYAPPTITDGGQGFGIIDGGVTTKYAPPTITDGGQGFGIIDGGVTTKYAPPSMFKEVISPNSKEW